MANIIKIKRSTTTATPASLAQGELAYSESSDNLFIGTAEVGNEATQEKIGGQSDVAKLALIEDSATADQTDAEIRTAVEAATDSNVFTDDDHTKLGGIATSATIDQTDAEIRTAVEAATDSNVFTDADHTKLGGIETSATIDQTDAEIRTAVEAATDSNVFTDDDHTKLGGIETSANDYSLPTSSLSVLGGIKVGDNLSITAGVLAAESSYSHPTHPGDDFSLDTTVLSGATVISDIDINVTTDTLGHVTDANGSVVTRVLTLADLSYTGATDANNYSLPTATSSILGGVKNGTGITNTAGVLSVSTAYLADSHDASGVTSAKITNWDTSYNLIAGDSNDTIDKINEVFAAFDSISDDGSFELLSALNAKMDDDQEIDGGTF